jgi:hypothetical protein
VIKNVVSTWLLFSIVMVLWVFLNSCKQTPVNYASQLTESYTLCDCEHVGRCCNQITSLSQQKLQLGMCALHDQAVRCVAAEGGIFENLL